jgi:hypothetical protein
MKSFVFLIIAFVVVFLSVMIVNDDTPSGAWRKIEKWTIRQLHLQGTVPVPAPSPIPEPPPASESKLAPTPEAVDKSSTPPTEETVPTPTPSPTPHDPIAWFIDHREGHLQEVKIKQQVEFPAVYEGKVIGSIKKPPGTSVKIVKVHPTNITVSFNGGSADIPIDTTDLLEVATSEMEKATQMITQAYSAVEKESKAVTNSSPTSPPTLQIDVKSVLEKPSIDATELSTLFSKMPFETASYLSSKVIKINGIIQKIQLLGMDSDRVELTLDVLNNKRIVLKLKLENLIDKSKIEGSAKNKLVLENGQLKLISELIRNGNSYYYYYWNGYQYVRNYYNGNYYNGPYGYRTSGRNAEVDTPICTEGTSISNWNAKLNSTNSASIYFDVIKLK